jgi:hypothetical protein
MVERKMGNGDLVKIDGECITAEQFEDTFGLAGI